MRSLPLVLLLCAAPASAKLVPVPPPNLGGPRCDDLDPVALAEAVERELPTLRKMNGTVTFADRILTWAQYASGTLEPLARLARQGREVLCSALPQRFAFYRNPDAGAGKFTAYHNPILRGSRTRHAPYLFPLYKRPTGEAAHFTTAQILDGTLEGRGLELVYLDDATAALAAQVEGSATILLDDNTYIAVASDGNNGFPYQNVSKLLLADNKIPKSQVTPISMTRARKYFIDHPAELNAYWAKNPHFVFFKEKPATGGAASGKFGPLTPGRSLAVDPLHVPLGVAVWFRTDMPRIADNKVAEWVSYGRVALGQDTGAGITGAGRVDVFFGTGEYAEQAAAVTTRPGELYVLLGR